MSSHVVIRPCALVPVAGDYASFPIAPGLLWVTKLFFKPALERSEGKEKFDQKK